MNITQRTSAQMTSTFKSGLFLTLSGLFFSAASSFGSVTLQMEIANVRDSSGALVSAGSIGVLVADTTSSGFATGQTGITDWAGTTLTAGNTVSGHSNEQILAVFQANNSLATGMGFTGNGGSVNFNLTGGISAGQNMELVWFPTISTVGSVVPSNVSQVGFYTNPTANAVSGGNTGFVVPADGANKPLAYFDSVIATGSGVSQANLSATAVTAAPEPSRALLALIGTGLTLFIRRRKTA